MLQTFVALVICAMVGCGSPRPVSSAPQATAPMRYLLGAAHHTEFNELLETTESSDFHSLSETRNLGWAILEKISNETNLTSQQKIPEFLTWYSRSDIERLARAMLFDLAPTERLREPEFSDQQWDSAIEENVRGVLTSPHWTADRIAELKKLNERIERLQSAHGNERVLYNPQLVRHLIGSVWQASHCQSTECAISDAPLGSAMVKLKWQRFSAESEVDTYDTSASTLAAIVGDSEKSWNDVLRRVPVDEGSFIAMEFSDRSKYILTGMHVAIKLQSDWVWTTFWWAPNPDRDFGSDRTTTLQMHPIWKNYKSCTSARFDAPFDDLSLSNPQVSELSAAMTVISEIAGTTSWCSNPYMERGANNQNTNCIGCHRQAGGGLSSEELLSSPDPFHSLLTRPQNNAPSSSDYMWTWGTNDQGILTMLRRLVAQYDRRHPLISERIR